MCSGKPALTIAAYLWLIMMAASARAEQSVQQGRVLSHTSPIGGSHVTLFLAGDEQGTGESVLGSDITNRHGFFRIPYTPPADPNAVLYLIADGPSAAVRFATVLGAPGYFENVTINERTTVATAYAMAQFIVDGRIGGRSPGLQNAAGTFRDLVDPVTGRIAAVLGSPPNGLQTSTMRTFNSLANMLVGCVRSPNYATAFFRLATPPGGNAPDNALQAAVNIAHYSWWNNSLLFYASLIYSPYRPVLWSAPETWALAIRYVGSVPDVGTVPEFGGPGAVAFDPDLPQGVVADDAWVFDIDTGTLVDSAGGGMSIPWGIAVDGNDDVWVADFGGQRLTQFDGATGKPVAPEGYPSDALERSTGVAIDSAGNVWLCNTGPMTEMDSAETNPSGDGLVVFIGLAAPVETPLPGPPQQP